MPKTCPHCKSSDLDVDPSRGDTVCMGCGSVLEENAIVSEVSFAENADGSSSVVGQFVSSEGQNKPHFSGFRHGMSKESRQMTLDRGRREIREMASLLNLNRHCVDTAFNFFKMAVQKRLTRGRRIQHIVAACLYMTCRTEGTPHVLLDFSDVTEVNVFTLGKTFLVLAKELHIHLPVLDPCMYITRFAHRMDFGEKTHEVCVAAMRLVSRMKRDWIHTGRRPSGLCGAALLVAARLHGYTCTLKDVVKVVRIGHDTIRKRLTEFVSTPSSQLTINEFMSIDLEAEADPPAFTVSRMKHKHTHLENFEEEIGELSNAIDKELEQPRKKCRLNSPPMPRSESPTDEGVDPEMKAAADFVHAENPEAVAMRMTANKLKNDNENPNVGPAPSPLSLGLNFTPEECFRPPAPPRDEAEKEGDGELDLTNIDDEEIDNLILSQSESMIKAKLWMAENGEYLKVMEERAEKRRLEQEERDKTRPRKRKKVIPKKIYYGESRTAGEAIEKLLHRQKLSNKINYEALKKVTEEPELDKPKPGSKFIDTFSNLAKYDFMDKTEPPMGEGGAFPKAEVTTIIEDSKEILNKKRKTKLVPCLNPTEEKETKVSIETGPIATDIPVAVETGPVAMADDDDIYEDEEESCMSASLLMQKAGVGDTSYGEYGYEGYDEYD